MYLWSIRALFYECYLILGWFVLYYDLYWGCRGGEWNIIRSLWIMAKKKLVPVAKKFAALFALRLELFRALKWL